MAVLDPKLFFRINQQFVVKMEAISSIYKFSATRLKLILNPAFNKETFVSTEKYSSFKE